MNTPINSVINAMTVVKVAITEKKYPNKEPITAATPSTAHCTVSASWVAVQEFRSPPHNL